MGRQPLKWLWIVMSVAALGCADNNSNNNADANNQDANNQDANLQDGPGTDGPIIISDAGVVITPDGGASYTCYPITCDNHLTECGDCLDNDGDGVIDDHDRECLGPCDNTEGPGLSAGVGGAGGNTCMLDCYFDYGNGPGNDKCTWDHRCDPLEPEGALCAYEASRVGTTSCPATQVTQCADLCKPLTPNGCDCFGCCTFPQLAGQGPGGSTAYVYIGALDSSNVSTCTFDEILNTTKCPRCTPVGNCLNTCERCEVCIGKPTPPADCSMPDAGAPVESQCPMGVTACGQPGQAACPSGSFCLSGCCRQSVG